MRSSQCFLLSPYVATRNASPCVYYSHGYANDTVHLWFHNQVEDPVGFRAFHLVHSLDFNGMHKLHGLTPELTVKLATSAQLLLHLTSFNYRRPGIPTSNLNIVYFANKVTSANCQKKCGQALMPKSVTLAKVRNCEDTL